MGVCGVEVLVSWGEVGFVCCLVLVSISHVPSLLGLLVLVLCLSCACVVGGGLTVWFGVAIWLVFISGLLVVFLFFCSLLSTTSRPGSFPPVWGVVIALLCGLVCPVLLGGSAGGGLGSVPPMVTIFVGGGPLVAVVWMLGILFLAIVVCVKITSSGHGALREVQ